MFDLRTNKARARADAPSVCPSHHIVSMSAAIQFSDTPHLLARVQLRWETNVSNGVCGVSFDRRDICMNKFLVSCLEARFHVFDARTQHPVKVSEPKPDAHVLVTSQPATSRTWKVFPLVSVSLCSSPQPRRCTHGLCRCIPRSASRSLPQCARFSGPIRMSSWSEKCGTKKLQTRASRPR